MLPLSRERRSPLTSRQSGAAVPLVGCSGVLDAGILSESNLGDLVVEGLKPLNEQVIHNDSYPCRGLCLAIRKREALTPKLMDNPVTTSIELR